MRDDVVAPVPPGAPPGEVRARLINARRRAVDLLRTAEEKEADARMTRRKARASLKHYEDLLAEFGGQLTVEDEGVSLQ